MESGSSNRKIAGVADERPAHRHPLALAARKLARLAAEQMLDLEELGDPRDGGRPFGSRHVSALHAERHVLGHGHGRVKRVGLEHHGDVAVLGMGVVDDPIADPDVATARLLKAGDDGEQRGLAAAGRAEEDDELAILRHKIDALEHPDRAEGFVQVDDIKTRHRGPFSLWG